MKFLHLIVLLCTLHATTSSDSAQTNPDPTEPRPSHAGSLFNNVDVQQARIVHKITLLPPTFSSVPLHSYRGNQPGPRHTAGQQHGGAPVGNSYLPPARGNSAHQSLPALPQNNHQQQQHHHQHIQVEHNQHNQYSQHNQHSQHNQNSQHSQHNYQEPQVNQAKGVQHQRRKPTVSRLKPTATFSLPPTGLDNFRVRTYHSPTLVSNDNKKNIHIQEVSQKFDTFESGNHANRFIGSPVFSEAVHSNINQFQRGSSDAFQDTSSSNDLQDNNLVHQIDLSANNVNQFQRGNLGSFEDVSNPSLVQYQRIIHQSGFNVESVNQFQRGNVDTFEDGSTTSVVGQQNPSQHGDFTFDQQQNHFSGSSEEFDSSSSAEDQAQRGTLGLSLSSAFLAPAFLQPAGPSSRDHAHGNGHDDIQGRDHAGNFQPQTPSQPQPAFSILPAHQDVSSPLQTQSMPQPAFFNLPVHREAVSHLHAPAAVQKPNPVTPQLSSSGDLPHGVALPLDTVDPQHTQHTGVIRTEPHRQPETKVFRNQNQHSVTLGSSNGLTSVGDLAQEKHFSSSPHQLSEETFGNAFRLLPIEHDSFESEEDIYFESVVKLLNQGVNPPQSHRVQTNSQSSAPHDAPQLTHVHPERFQLPIESTQFQQTQAPKHPATTGIPLRALKNHFLSEGKPLDATRGAVFHSNVGESPDGSLRHPAQPAPLVDPLQEKLPAPSSEHPAPSAPLDRHTGFQTSHAEPQNSHTRPQPSHADPQNIPTRVQSFNDGGQTSQDVSQTTHTGPQIFQHESQNQNLNPQVLNFDSVAQVSHTEIQHSNLPQLSASRPRLSHPVVRDPVAFRVVTSTESRERDSLETHSLEGISLERDSPETHSFEGFSLERDSPETHSLEGFSLETHSLETPSKESGIRSLEHKSVENFSLEHNSHEFDSSGVDSVEDLSLEKTLPDLVQINLKGQGNSLAGFKANDFSQTHFVSTERLSHEDFSHEKPDHDSNEIPSNENHSFELLQYSSEGLSHEIHSVKNPTHELSQQSALKIFPNEAVKFEAKASPNLSSIPQRFSVIIDHSDEIISDELHSIEHHSDEGLSDELHSIEHHSDEILSDELHSIDHHSDEILSDELPFIKHNSVKTDFSESLEDNSTEFFSLETNSLELPSLEFNSHETLHQPSRKININRFLPFAPPAASHARPKSNSFLARESQHVETNSHERQSIESDRFNSFQEKPLRSVFVKTLPGIQPFQSAELNSDENNSFESNSRNHNQIARKLSGLESQETHSNEFDSHKSSSSVSLFLQESHN